MTWAKASDIPPGAWRWPFVNPATEWACKGTGRVLVVPEFMDRLHKLRVAWARPLIITSGYRSPEHNLRVAQSGADGPHTTGRAVDIRIYGTHVYHLLELAYAHGFTGIGLDQTGPIASRILHLDDLTDGPASPRPWIWTY